MGSGANSGMSTHKSGHNDYSMLIREVDLLHRQIFGRVAPPGLVQHYVRAHAELADLTEASQQEIRTVRIVVERGLDASAIEPWLRSRPTTHLLTRKLLLVAYLAECDAEHPEFRRQVTGRVRGFMQLGRSSALGVMHLLRGRLQKVLHGLL